MADELYPAYIALIRHEFKLGAGIDALTELKERLSTDDPARKPPTRAPGITRLRKSLRRLEAHKAPTTSPDAFAEDLRFLQLFAPGEPILSPEGSRRLLDDIFGKPAHTPSKAKVTPMPRRSKKRSTT